MIEDVEIDEDSEEPAKHQWVEQLVAAVNGNVIVRVVTPRARTPAVGHVLVISA